MVPKPQQPLHPLQIPAHPFRLHTHQPPGVPTRRHDPLRPHTSHLIEREQGVRYHLRRRHHHRLVVVMVGGGGRRTEQGAQNEGVLDGLRGALPLVRRRGVRRVAHYRDAAFGVGRRWLVVVHCPDGGGGRGEEELWVVR